MKKRLPKTLFVLFVTLLCILIPAYDVMTAYSAMINNALNIQSYRVVESDIAADYDSEYFKADFSDPEAYAKAAAELCRQVEAEGLVLLTNQNGALPLPEQAKVSFFAQGAVYPGYGSTGSSAARTDGYGSLRTAFEKKGFSVNGALWDWYAQKAARLRLNTVDGLVKTYRTNELPWEDVTAAQGESFANFGDAAIVVLTRDSGEGFDVSTKGSDGLDGSYLSITREEENLLKGLTELKQSGVFDEYTFRYFNVQSNKFEVEGGAYDILVAASSEDIRLTGKLEVKGTGAADPYTAGNPAKAKLLDCYRSCNVHDVPDASFTALLGHPIPQKNWDRTQPLGMNDTIRQMAYAPNPICRMVAKILGNMIAKAIAGGKPDLNLLFIYNLPFRGMGKMMGGMITMDMADDIRSIANGHFFRGVGRLVMHFLNRPNLTKAK